MNSENVYIVDDDKFVRVSTEAVLKTEGYNTTVFSSGESFLETAKDLSGGCVLLDVKMSGMSGLQVLRALRGINVHYSVVMMSGHGDIPMALEAVKLGALDFIEKPFPFDTMLQALDKACENCSARDSQDAADTVGNTTFIMELTDREKQILKLLVQGNQNKIIAKKLGISHRTVEVHRSRIMQRSKAKSFAELVRMAVNSNIVLD